MARAPRFVPHGTAPRLACRPRIRAAGPPRPPPSWLSGAGVRQGVEIHQKSYIDMPRRKSSGARLTLGAPAVSHGEVRVTSEVDIAPA